MTDTRKPDRRIQRTRQALRDALIALITEKGYETITVQDIADRANLARATFYLHYKDKEDLMLRSLEESYDELVEHVEKAGAEDPARVGIHSDLIVFQHVAEYAEFYRIILGRRGVASFTVQIRHYLAKVTRKIAVDLTPEHLHQSPMFDMMLHTQAGALIALVSWWLENDMPYTPQQMAEFSQGYCMFGLPQVLGVAPEVWLTGKK